MENARIFIVIKKNSIQQFPGTVLNILYYFTKSSNRPCKCYYPMTHLRKRRLRDMKFLVQGVWPASSQTLHSLGRGAPWEETRDGKEKGSRGLLYWTANRVYMLGQAICWNFKYLLDLLSCVHTDAQDCLLSLIGNIREGLGMRSNNIIGVLCLLYLSVWLIFWSLTGHEQVYKEKYF